MCTQCLLRHPRLIEVRFSPLISIVKLCTRRVLIIAICMMYLRVSKLLHVPTHSNRLTNASASHLFSHYTLFKFGVFCFIFQCFSCFNLPNQYESRKNKYGQRKRKSPLETKYEDELPRIRSCQQEGLKHRLIDVDAVPVLIRYAWKQRF